MSSTDTGLSHLGLGPINLSNVAVSGLDMGTDSDTVSTSSLNSS